MRIELIARRAALMVALSLAGAQAVQAQNVTICGPLRSEGQYGPWDYRKDFDKQPIVIGAHFTPEIEALVRGRTASTPGPDIDYTLRAIPNHPRALVAMMNLAEKEKRDTPIGTKYSIECWFERAIRFQPDDQVVRMIYASFLMRKQRAADAREQLKTVEQLAGENPLTFYNLGLLYVELKDYDRALVNAHKAYAQGVIQPGLREQLQKAGQWSEPAAAEPAASGASSPSPAQ